MDRPRAQTPTGPDTPPTEPMRTGTRPDALLPGTRLEEFEIERVIGASGFGLVYLANDEAFERRVAIKEYLPDTLAMRGSDGVQVVLRASAHADAFERGRRAFIEEAQLLARCHHSSLVQVQRHWESNGTVYRAMAHYAGHSLLELRQAMDTPPDEASLRALLDGLLGALETLHAAGALHREIAPQHILLLPDDRPVLLDAGAARRAIVGDQARALMMLLAPSFAPPEQTAPSPERPIGPWTDLYSLAAVVKYCLTGELPPPASLFTPPPHEPMATLVERMRATWPQLHYSPAFLSALDAALVLAPRDRLRDVAQWRARLDDHPPPVVLDSSEPALAAVDWGEPRDDDADEDRTLGPFYDPPPARPPAEKPPRPEQPAKPPPAERPMDRPVAAEPPAPRPFAAERPVAAERPAQRPLAAERPAPMPEPAPAARPADELRIDPPARPPRREPVEPFIAHYGAPAAPVLGLAERSHRRHRRWGTAGLLLLAVAIAGGGWLFQRQQQASQAESDFAQAARRDGLTANVPAVPKSPEAAEPAPATAPTTAAAPAPAPTVAATESPPAPAATVAAAEPELPQAPTAAVAPTTPVAGSGTESAPPTVVAAAPTPPVEEEVVEPAPPRQETRAAPRANGRSAAAPRPVAAKAPPPERTAAARAPASPRDACGNRTQFSLYRCMQTQCAQARWTQHPLCKRLRLRDEVD